MRASQDSGTDVEILPLVIVTRAFPARPSSLPDVRDFVRRQLTNAPLADDDVRTLCERVADVLLDAAGANGTIQVSLRIFTTSAEVDVLFAPDGEVAALPDRPGLTPPDRHPPLNERAPASPPGAAQAPLLAVPHSPNASFAGWLSARLRREGMTMEAAAQRLNVSAKTVSRWVGGTTEPRLRDLYRIRDVFGEPPFQ